MNDDSKNNVIPLLERFIMMSQKGEAINYTYPKRDENLSQYLVYHSFAFPEYGVDAKVYD